VTGNTAVFHQRPPPPKLRHFARRARMGIFLFWGRLGLPLPFPAHLTVVVGRPVVAVPGESVAALHARYVAALCDLFERYKTLAGQEWAHKTLHIT